MSDDIKIIHPQTFNLFLKVAEDILQTPSEKKEENPGAKALKNIAGGLGGVAIGSLAGLGGMQVADALHKHFRGRPIGSPEIAVAAPLVSAALGMTYNMWQQRQVAELENALESYKERARKGEPPR